ncbi:MAG TPA: hypothetical protein VMB26_10500 [Candidatus Binataceae bacterium]|nr:hypothetical protein [Candidatus Binataceae bacterium]
MTNSWMGKAVRVVASAILMLTLAACTPNPLLGKWSIKSRDKETDASYIDELTSNVRTSTGAKTIEFRKDSIVVSGGPQEHTETGIKYIINELEGGATDVQIVQARKGDPDNNDVDVCHIDSTGNSAQLESRNELVDLTRIGQ